MNKTSLNSNSTKLNNSGNVSYKYKLKRKTKKSKKVHEGKTFKSRIKAEAFHPADLSIKNMMVLKKSKKKTFPAKYSTRYINESFYSKPHSGNKRKNIKDKRRNLLGLKRDVEMNSSLFNSGLLEWSNSASSKKKVGNERFIIKDMLDPKYIPPGAKILPMSGDEPQFAKWLWSAKKKFIESNNCYAYAANQFRFHRNMKAQPGNNRKYVTNGEYQNTFINCKSLTDNVLKDAGKKAYSMQDENTACKKGTYKIMLFVAPDPEHNDFHFFRQDKDGTWSHKQGWGYGPSKLDASGKIIFNPRTSDLNYKPYNYHEYCSSMCIPKQFKYNI